jgi:hypothetical protein
VHIDVRAGAERRQAGAFQSIAGVPSQRGCTTAVLFVIPA